MKKDGVLYTRIFLLPEVFSRKKEHEAWRERKEQKKEKEKERGEGGFTS